MAKLSNSPKQTLNFDLERRKSFTFRTRLRHKDGTLVDLSGCTLRFVMKQQGAEEDPFDLNNLIVNHEANIGDPSSGEAMFAFQAAELDGDPGEYDYSIVLWTPDNYSTVLCKGVVNLVGNSESHSMHRMYSAMRPGSTVDLQIKSDDVVEITAGETVQLVTKVITVPGSGGVSSVAGRTGAVVLSSADLTDFIEAVQDIVGAMVAGAGGSYNNTTKTITLPPSP